MSECDGASARDTRSTSISPASDNDVDDDDANSDRELRNAPTIATECLTKLFDELQISLSAVAGAPLDRKQSNFDVKTDTLYGAVLESAGLFLKTEGKSSSMEHSIFGREPPKTPTDPFIYDWIAQNTDGKTFDAMEIQISLKFRLVLTPRGRNIMTKAEVRPPQGYWTVDSVQYSQTA